ncbi:MAG: hypothetical protein HQK56_10380, partial [Deltaproteobacteria bacterium]|nr:hypothetical protein [Deltaproteobacteria bacterium]
MTQTNSNISMNNSGAGCAGITAKGNPCKNRPLPGERFCRVHHPGAASEDRTAPRPDQSNPREISGLAGDVLLLLKEAATQVYRGVDKLAGTVGGTTGLSDTIKDHVAKFKDNLTHGGVDFLKQYVNEDYLNPDMYIGLWYVLNGAVEYKLDML